MSKYGWNDNSVHYNTVTLRGGESLWEAYAEEVGTDESPTDGWIDINTYEIDQMQVMDDTVLRFGKTPDTHYSDVFLDVKNIDFYKDSLLIVDIGPHFGGFHLDRSSSSLEAMRHIALRVNGQLRQSRWIDHGSYFIIDNNQINDPWTPLPEPATYGAVGAAGLCGLMAWRRRKRIGR